ncbi:TetR/AcrR family transcriptional regulator [Arthrobacter burdickii]|uniref:TetR/AcrR family transcriptional regulator n=1 Tax=Arthrobacter burdickii TaxID=3035920 RepID=A0ABT8K7M3_9MICC|nr:TetR/AcrR family transcriptional regulator [Arthrobacter burdickii]MDN4612359.1 TetR/AcrR family transcriptional regulator [Arthrobacter burdickii]
MTTRGLRGPYAKGEERRRTIVQTATDVFATEGFEGAALKHVAELVGVREATLFHYFSSKQELQQAVLAERDERARELIGEAQFSVDHLPAVAKRNEQQPGLTALYAVASATAHEASHASHQYFRERYEMLVREMAREVTERQRSGEYRTDIDPEWAGRLLIGVFDGIQIQWLYDKGVSMQEGLRQAMALLKAPTA